MNPGVRCAERAGLLEELGLRWGFSIVLEYAIIPYLIILERGRTEQGESRGFLQSLPCNWVKQLLRVRNVISYTLIDAALGWIGLVRSPIGLRRVILPQSSPERVVELLGIRTTDLERDISVFGDLPERLRGYLEGQKVSFDDKVDFVGTTGFHQAVWEETRAIPYGESRSYTWVAEQVGKPGAARAVGQAMAKNPVPLVVPCHRVIASGGGLGGYGGDLELKRYLLEMESKACPQNFEIRK